MNTHEYYAKEKACKEAKHSTYQLERHRDARALGYHEEKWQGGPRKIYHPLMNENEFVRHIVKTLALSMMKDFPEVTKDVLSSMIATESQ